MYDFFIWLKDKTNKNVVYLYFILLFIVLYIFYRYVHPVIPWDGDDWYTISAINDYNYCIPSIGYAGYLPQQVSTRFFWGMFGSFFAYLAAFVVYPFSGDYIMSFAVVTAVYLAALISTTIVFLYKLLFGITKNVSTSLLGCSFF